MPVSPVFTTLQYPPSSPTTALPQTAMHSRSQSLPVLSNAAFSMPSLPPTKGFLQFFNEEAARRRVVPNYSQVGGFTGEPHAPIWTFVVSINDEEKGRGSAGPSKQDAKEVAARQAYINMGWNVTGRV
ncbi:hypothetical protein NEOLEDRAFT_1126577 [Neolentinus lepideus HHB14362 ss-1]|uniref:DRBM domain-containing protein n=1 Tax=Neolentinus lepideus HHB14362 ss-1 TaxID=1314782 RepID=A0A165WAG7_9AGAM|nr:hypothetical protein NEOLEDRAFT_1126577 [Neolentinus lepideus HHB14362 ss-1]